MIGLRRKMVNPWEALISSGEWACEMESAAARREPQPVAFATGKSKQQRGGGIPAAGPPAEEIRVSHKPEITGTPILCADGSPRQGSL